jgi:phage shock protein E
MKYGLCVLAAVILLAAFVWTAGAAEHTKDTPQDVKQAVADGKAVLLDVREKEEWDAGHLRAARLLPLSVLQDAVKADELARSVPKGKVIYCHCAAGRRSLQAADILKPFGYDVRPLEPGYQALLKAGFEPAPR